MHWIDVPDDDQPAVKPASVQKILILCISNFVVI